MECHEIPKDPASELLSGEDFSRLNETAPRLMRALAEGAGTSVNDLRKMAGEGRLTSSVLLGSLAAPRAAITEPMIEAGIDALEEVAGLSYLRALAVEVYTAMELARQKGPGMAGKTHPC